MSTQRYISTSFWDDMWIQELDPSEKLLYMYLMTNPLTNIAGVYKISDRRISFDTGFNIETITNIIKKFTSGKKAFRVGEYIALPSWPKHQKWETSDPIKKGIETILKELDPEEIEKLYEMGYKYDLSKYRTNTPDVPPIDTRSYSDLDIDLDIDTDIDINVDPPKPKKQKEVRHKYGDYSNCCLTDEQRLKLTDEYGEEKAKQMITNFDNYVESTGKKYKNHLQTMRNWAKKDQPEQPKPKEKYVSKITAEELESFKKVAGIV